MATATHNRHKGTTEPIIGTPDQWLPVGHYDPYFVESTEHELDRLSKLPPNWDQYGAPQIDRSIIAAAVHFIRALPANIVFRPRVVPMSPGNLQFEWHQGKKILEIEFETPEKIRFLQWDPEAGLEEEDTFLTKDIDRAVDLIHWFISGACI